MKSDFLIKLQCKECSDINYYTRRNKKTNQEKLALSKFCRRCGKHTGHKEIK